MQTFMGLNFWPGGREAERAMEQTWLWVLLFGKASYPLPCTSLNTQSTKTLPPVWNMQVDLKAIAVGKGKNSDIAPVFELQTQMWLRGDLKYPEMTVMFGQSSAGQISHYKRPRVTEVVGAADNRSANANFFRLHIDTEQTCVAAVPGRKRTAGITHTHPSGNRKPHQQS